MGTYIVRRLIAMILMLLALSMIVFLLFKALPADPARADLRQVLHPAGHRAEPAPARARQAPRTSSTPTSPRASSWAAPTAPARPTFECPAPVPRLLLPRRARTSPT